MLRIPHTTAFCTWKDVTEDGEAVEEFCCRCRLRNREDKPHAASRRDKVKLILPGESNKVDVNVHDCAKYVEFGSLSIRTSDGVLLGQQFVRRWITNEFRIDRHSNGRAYMFDFISTIHNTCTLT